MNSIGELSTVPNYKFVVFVHIALNTFDVITLGTITLVLFNKLSTNAIEFNAGAMEFRPKLHYPNCKIPE